MSSAGIAEPIIPSVSLLRSLTLLDSGGSGGHGHHRGETRVAVDDEEQVLEKGHKMRGLKRTCSKAESGLKSEEQFEAKIKAEPLEEDTHSLQSMGREVKADVGSHSSCSAFERNLYSVRSSLGSLNKDLTRATRSAAKFEHGINQTRHCLSEGLYELREGLQEMEAQTAKNLSEAFDQSDSDGEEGGGRVSFEPVPVGVKQEVEEKEVDVSDEGEETGKSFSSESDSDSDSRSQSKRKKKRKYVCRFLGCIKSFFTASSLRQHTRVHSVDRDFKCNVDGCEKAYNHQTDLKRHQDLKHSVGPPQLFICRECGKQYTRKEALKYHVLAVHSKVNKSTTEALKALTCEFCSKMFSQPKYLKVHRRQHLGDRPYACGFCDLTFTRVDVKKKHELRAHSEGRRYHSHKNTVKDGEDFDFVCNVNGCHFGTNWRTSLDRHKALRHGPDPQKLRCPQDGCEKVYSVQSMLNVHLRKIHSLSPEKPECRRSSRRSCRVIEMESKEQHLEVLSDTDIEDEEDQV